MWLAPYRLPKMLVLPLLKLQKCNVGLSIVLILKILGFGIADINTVTKGGCVSCSGISLKTVGTGLFIDTGKGLNFGTQNSGNGNF